MERRKYPEEALPKHVFFQEGPGLRKWQWTDEGMKVINVTNIIGDGSVDLRNTDRYISSHEYETRYQHFAIDADDILVASSGNTYGKVGRISVDQLPVMMNTSVVRFHSNDPNEVDDDYLYAYLRSVHFRNQIEQFVTGGAQPNFGPSHIKQMKIIKPDIAQQKSIAQTILGYDRLIANNRRRIKLLEKAASLIYREWFVHLRFPGHEHIKIVDDVPDGWRKAPASDAMEVLSGGTPKTDKNEFWNGDIPFFTPKDVKDTLYVFATEKTITESGLRACNSRLYAQDTVFITARGTVGKLCLALKPMAMSQSNYALVAKPPLDQYFLYFAVQNSIEYFRSYAGGSVFDAIVVDTFRRIPLVLPSKDKIEAFSEIISPIVKQTGNLIQQIEFLKNARDFILPRLMSGELEV